MLIYPYKTGSESARHLSELLEAKRIKHTNSRFRGRQTKTVVNWGSSELPEEVMRCRVINLPEAVRLCSNKLRFFEAMEPSGVVIPDWTTSQEVAQGWVNGGSAVFERHSLTGNSGQGIVIVEEGGEVGRAPLYTKYVPKKDEFRVHVISGQAVLTQKKVKRADVNPDDVNWKIRNHDGGFIFQQNGIDVPDAVTEQALLAVETVGLHFGAVDVIYNRRSEQAYVLEINTAPGLMGSTGELYAEHLRVL